MSSRYRTHFCGGVSSVTSYSSRVLPPSLITLPSGVSLTPLSPPGLTAEQQGDIEIAIKIITTDHRGRSHAAVILAMVRWILFLALLLLEYKVVKCNRL